MKYVTGGPPRFAHQRQGLRRAIETKGVLALLMSPGTGKTATALDFMGLLALKSPRREARVLVVAPYAAVDTWVKQAPYWLSPQVNVWAEVLGGTNVQKAEALAARGDQPWPKSLSPKTDPKTYSRALLPVPRALHHRKAWATATRTPDGSVEPSLGPGGLGDELPRVVIEVVNFESMSRQRDKVPGTSKSVGDAWTSALERFDPDLLVLDESHRAKSPSGSASQLLARLARRVPRRMLLSGTIMPHSPMDVFSQWRILDPLAFGKLDRHGQRQPATFGGFKDEFAQLGGFMGREIVGFRNLDRMQEIMARNSFVVRKEDALDLPQTTDVIHPVRLSAKEEKAYRQMKSELASTLNSGLDTVALSRLTQRIRLRQITSGHITDDEHEVQTLGDSKIKTIASVVNDELADERRVVVFSYFSHEIEALSEALGTFGTEVLKVTGATSQAVRMAHRERFGSDDSSRLVLVAQIKTMSVAVNELVTASHAVFGSLSEQRDDLIQARDRLNRIGQTRPVTFHYCLAPGTVDEVIYRTMQDRTDLEAAMLNHIRS